MEAVWVNVAKDAAATAVTVGLFPDRASASEAFLFMSSLEKLSIREFGEGKYENFNPARLSEDPYPPHNRPRGKADLASVAFHRRVLRKGGELAAVVVLERRDGSRYTLDGVHRVVAAFLEKRKHVMGIVIKQA